MGKEALVRALLLIAVANCHASVGTGDDCPAIYMNKRNCLIEGTVVRYVTYCRYQNLIRQK